jgi:hypothetical protein
MALCERRILEMVAKLKKLEKEFLKFTYEVKKPHTEDESLNFLGEAYRIGAEAFKTRNIILEGFMEASEIITQDSDALRLLDSIRRGDKIYSISFYENVCETLGVKPEDSKNKKEEYIRDLVYEKFDIVDFHGEFDVTSYYFKKIMIGPIISSSKVPSHLLSYFNEVKEAYAFGQYRATTALCRSLLEIALYQKLKNRGAFKNKDPKLTSIDVAKEDNLFCYIKLAKRKNILSDNNSDVAHRIRKAANVVLHVKESETPIDAKVVVDTIFSTLRIIEDLYRYNYHKS